MHRLMCVALVVATACGGGTSGAPQTLPTAPAAAGPSCDTMAGHVIDLLAKGSPDAPPDMVKKIHDTLQRHCEQDAWTAAQKQCFASMETPEQGNKCEDALTDAQKKSLQAEDTGEKSNATTAPPPPPGGGGSRGKPGKGGDPCDGGE